MHRSPYAKSLEDNKYRQRIINKQRVIDADEWIEEALKDYYDEKNMGQEREDAQEDISSVISNEEDHRQDGRTNGEMVDVKEEKGRKE